MIGVKPFVIKTLLLVGLFLIAYLGLNYYVAPQYFLKSFYIQLGIISVLTIGSYIGMVKVVERNKTNFAFAFMIMIGVRLLVYMILLTIYIMNWRETALVYSIAFFVHYFVFTIFEILHLLRLIKKL